MRPRTGTATGSTARRRTASTPSSLSSWITSSALQHDKANYSTVTVDPAPALDFLYPTFGFFSRSLPSRKASASIDPRQSSSSTRVDLVTGYRIPQRVNPTSQSTWRFTTAARIGSLPSSSSSSTCVCGRMISTCLRCRALNSSSSSSPSSHGFYSLPGSVSKVSGPRSTTRQSLEASEGDLISSQSVNDPQAELSHSSSSSISATSKTNILSSTSSDPHKSQSSGSSSSTPPSSSPTPSIETVRKFINASISKYGHLPIPYRPVPTSPHTRNHRKQVWSTQLDEVRRNLSLIDDYLKEENLDLKDRLNLVKLYSSIVRSQPLVSHEPGANVDLTTREREAIVEMRKVIGESMRVALADMDDESYPRYWNSLWIDSLALRGELPAVIEFDPESSAAGQTETIDQEYLRRMKFLFLGEDSEAFTRTQQQLLPLLFESFRDDKRPEQALNLFCGWGAAERLLKNDDDPVSSILRRLYGASLAQLDPTPFGFYLKSSSRHHSTKLGEHLIEYLATSGSTLEALKIYRHMSANEVLLQDHEMLKLQSRLLDGLLDSRYLEDAHRISTELLPLARRLVLKPDFEPMTRNAFRLIVKTAAERGDEDTMDKALRESRVGVPETSLVIAARRMRYATRRRDIETVEKIYEEAMSMVQTTAEDRARLTGTYVQSLVQIDDLETAIRVLDDSLLPKGDRPTLNSVNQILFGFATRHDVDSTYAIFGRLARGDFGVSLLPNLSSYHALLVAHANVRDVEAALQIMSEMKKAGFKPDRSVWTTLLNLYVELGQYTKAFEVYEFLERNVNVKLRPDTATLNVLLKAAVLASSPTTTVVKWFHEAVLRGLRPNLMTYTIVMQAVCAAGMMDVAEELYQMMDRPSGRIAPDTQDDEDITALPISMSRVKPDVFIFSTLISGYLKAKETEKASACLAEMRRRGIEPTSVTYGLIVKSIMKGNTVETRQRAKDFAKKFLDLSPLKKTREKRSSAKQDRALARGDELLQVFGPILQKEAKSSDGQTVLDTFKLVLNAGARPSIELYTILMDSFRKDCLATLRLVRRDRTKPVAINGPDDVLTVWNGLHRSILDAYGTPTQTYEAPQTPSIFPSSSESFEGIHRISKYHRTDLCLPLTILIDSISYFDPYVSQVEQIWSQLADEGFYFDAGNYNSLARHFIRQKDLARGLWIIEKILLVRYPKLAGAEIVSETVVEEQMKEAESIFRDVKISRGEGNPRLPSRIALTRNNPEKEFAITPESLATYLSGRALTTIEDEPSPDLSSFKSRSFVEAIEEARIDRLRRIWTAYRATWIAFDRALEETGQSINAFASEFPKSFRAFEEWRTRRDWYR